ncbi:MAG: lytic transglycosylase domain-containing protein [Alphaproteobacteria bacterium]|nr:lytic transglycosylase domain-containing protein [Alphaproteobacteria bacterium]MBV9553202.1 lytic transglycosylase domain-containing protein [Alphaproteobacteria bacterium]
MWIRAVMRVESNGDSAATSPKGAMGLMQVMPATYADLSDRYGLGEDGYELRNNVLAGSAYLREMYDRYGPAGFLAAYNAGPGRFEDSLCRRCSLPEETKRYVASVRLALGEVLFGEPKSRFYEPLAVSRDGALLLKRTGEPVPVAERLALHSLVERAAKRAAAAAK